MYSALMTPHVLQAWNKHWVDSPGLKWNKHWVDSPGFNTSSEPCSRCDGIAENYPPGAAYINGHQIDDFVLCRECRQLLVDNKRKFYDEEWAKYPRCWEHS